MPVLNVNTTALTVLPINNRRKKLFFQNTGKEKIYITKQNFSNIPNIPSSTNYDYILYPSEYSTNGNKGFEFETTLEIETTSRINAVSENDGSKLAYFETVLI